MDSQMRNRETPNPTHIKGLLTLSVEKYTDFKGPRQRESRILAMEEVGGGQRETSPLFQNPYIFTRAFSKFIHSGGLCNWLRNISP